MRRLQEEVRRSPARVRRQGRTAGVSWLAAVAAGVAATASCAAPAVAAAAPPAREPACLGLAFEDPAGDQAARLQGVTVVPAGPNTDVLGGFFTLEDGKAFAHIVISALSREMPQHAEAIIWMMRWKSGPTENWVAADLLKDGTLFFSFGHFDGSTLVEDGRLDGEFGHGPRGVIRIPIPASHGGAAGSTLTDPWVRVYGLFGRVDPLDLYALSLTIDRGPDSGFGRTATLAECPPPTGRDGAAPPPRPSAPGPPPDGGLRAEREGGRAGLPIRLLGPRRVRLAHPAALLTFRLRAQEPIAGLRIRLRRGDRTYAGVRVGRLTATRTVRLRPRRTIRPGTYRLEVDGTDSRGRHRVRVFRARVSR